MTKSACRWCGRKFKAGSGPGRPRVFCRQSCRQRDYEARRRAEELGLGEHELVITREELEGLKDRMYVLACTLEDVERDLGSKDLTKTEALNALREAARECVNGPS